MLMYDDPEIFDRKFEHIKIVVDKDVDYRIGNWFNFVHLIHMSLPELDIDDIDTSILFLGRKFSYPILIDSMTGGTEKAYKINGALGELAAKYNIPVSCGSQKAGLLDKELIYTYKVLRDVCPECFLIANIGGMDIVSDPVNIAQEVVSMIEADAIAIHLNPLQEAVQHESKPKYASVLNSIQKICDSLDVPVIAKETGAGISMGVAKALESVGVSAINISGSGGTSWSAVEVYRNLLRSDRLMAEVGKTFWNWGIPTAASLIEVVSSVNIPVIASGGIRTGIEIVKSLVLGASLTGIAAPFLRAYYKNELDFYMEKLINEVKVAMFLVGAADVESLRKVDYVITGDLLEWCRQRGLCNEQL